jgi:hypothetical protein
MIKMLRLVARPGATLALVMIAMPVLAQAPSDAQRAAIRSACRSDYMAHCSSVPPGGLESLQCLQKNMASLSGSCKTAVNAVEAPAAPAAKSETPAAAPKAESPTAAEPAKPAATAAPAAVPKAAAGTAAKKPASGASTAAPAADSAPATAAAPAAVIVLRPMRPREELFVLRSACGGDVRSLCAGVPPGGGRIVTCLATNATSLSPACKDVLGQFSASQ